MPTPYIVEDMRWEESDRVKLPDESDIKRILALFKDFNIEINAAEIPTNKSVADLERWQRKIIVSHLSAG